MPNDNPEFYEDYEEHWLPPSHLFLFVSGDLAGE